MPQFPTSDGADARPMTLVQTLALLPPGAVALWVSPGLAAVLVSALVTALAWEAAFALLRGHAITAHGITTALIVTLFCPPEIAGWQIAVAVTLGVVFGELVFGGRGFGFVSPAALALATLIVAFPDVALRGPTPLMAALVLPGLAVLIGTGRVFPTVLVGAVLGALALLMLTDHPVMPLAHAVALSVGAVFLIADPAAGSVTAAGRWAYGALAGGLAILFSPGAEILPEAVVSAALLASVFAPLLDYLAVLIPLPRRRQSGHG